jgi:hypothetical protein
MEIEDEDPKPSRIRQVAPNTGRPTRKTETRTHTAEYQRAHQLHQIARNFRDAILDESKGPDGKGKECTPLSHSELSRRGRRLAEEITGKTPLTPALQALRASVPLIPKERVMEAIKGNTGDFEYYNKGTESFVCLNKEKSLVLKFTPIKTFVLDIPHIVANAPIYAKPIAHPLCNQFVAVTTFYRNEMLCLLPGIASTEITGVAETGHITTTQKFLGEEEPSMRELQEWALKHGYTILPPQDDDPEKVPGTDLPVTEGASSAMPLIYKHDNTIYLAVDVVPRNARKLPNGEIFVFDLTVRPLLNTEIKAHPQLSSIKIP